MDKVIYLMTDTFRYDHIGANGNKDIYTPNIDWLAERSTCFDKFYASSFPTRPNRRDIHLGHGYKDFYFNRWAGIDTANETPLSAHVGSRRKKTPHTIMFNDVANCMWRGGNFYEGFNEFVCVRGQEGDFCGSDYNVELSLPDYTLEATRYRQSWEHQIQMNRAEFRHEKDWYCSRVYNGAIEWLERNYKRDSFLLWVETFEPHEPWEPPQWWVDRYDPDYRGRVITGPTYGRLRNAGFTDREIKHIHARYCGEISHIDFQIGLLLRTLEKLDLIDEVGIVFNTDHGTCMSQPGDDGLIGKPTELDENQLMHSGGGHPPMVEHMPIRESLIHIPFMVHMPGQKKQKRVKQTFQSFDVAPTVLEMFDIPKPERMVGQSLIPLTQNKKVKSNPWAYSGMKLSKKQLTTRDWQYVFYNDGAQPAALFDLKNDPDCRKDVAAKNDGVCKRMQNIMAKEDSDVPRFGVELDKDVLSKYGGALS